MSKRSRNGAIDPYISRRVGKSHLKNYRQTVIPIQGNRFGMRDDPETLIALTEIARQAREKEASIANAIGPHSTPSVSYYPKSFRLPAKKVG